MEELEYLTKTFAIELNAELNYSDSYATEGNEIYQIEQLNCRLVFRTHFCKEMPRNWKPELQ
ncbi:hypothetical protein DCO56_09110 [Sphingobacterium athyrii]|uniref:Uncharacterized protein n=1 Tax=Sphingobacterium athyrii TaxID=2152717 RepID=A0A363NWH3_9SPHI|nr:hypothetical protein DCO56_09110 [Sphingobacterium athyrii]